MLGTLQHFLKANRIMRVSGILNGTTNFILTQMGEHQRPFEEVLAEAQRRGYAEAIPPPMWKDWMPPTNWRFSAVSPSGPWCPSTRSPGGASPTFPPRSWSWPTGWVQDQTAGQGGAVREEGPVALQVGPTLVPLSHPLAGINGVYNAIHVEADTVQDVTLVGQGAGEQPTASAMVEDLCNLFRLPLPRPLP